MKVTVVLEERAQSTPDGAVWTMTPFTYNFWRRYLDVFDEVTVVGRVAPAPSTSLSEEWRRADGPKVRFQPLPYYFGPVQYARKLPQIKRAVVQAVSEKAAVILRIPSAPGTIAFSHLSTANQPYGVEVVGDPYDVFARGAVKLPLPVRLYFRWWFSRGMRQQCAQAVANAYVTKNVLQRRYPPATGSFSTYYSSVNLPPTAFVNSPRSYDTEHRTFTLSFVGTLDILYKGPDILIKALAVCVEEGLDLRLILAGDGKYRKELESLTASLGLNERVSFRGKLPAGEAVHHHLDQSDMFVLPSLADGMPRAMIEAMARGLPCIGSNVSGIPELLPQEDLVPPRDVAALAKKIRVVVTEPGRMSKMSARNLEKAKEFSETVLQERRVAFYREVRTKTALWLKSNGNHERQEEAQRGYKWRI